MRIDYVNQQIMDALLYGYTMVRYAPLDSDDPAKPLYIVCTDGFVAYVLEGDEIYFNLHRCHKAPDAFKLLLQEKDATAHRIDNMLTPTLDIRVATGAKSGTIMPRLNGEPAPRLLARFKGAAWDTFVDMDLLEAFDNARYYQARKTGPVAIVEDGRVVGYVMPCKAGDEEGHYTDTPTYEDAETPA